MPLQSTLKINEIFSSFQGEGLRQGEPTIFIRLSGCNLRCSFCDTRHAWEEGRDMTASQIIERVESLRQEFPTEWVCLTGGEPLLQNIQTLLDQLKTSGFMLQVETNATFPPKSPVDWLTISPKPVSYYFHPAFSHSAKEVKLVISEELHFSTVNHLRKLFPDQIPILLQPKSNSSEAMEKGTQLIEKALKSGLKNLRLSIQLHKLYKWR